MGFKKIASCALLFFSVNAISEELTISVQDFPPFVTVKEGQVTGVFVDIVKRISFETKIDIKTTIHPNRRSKYLLRDGGINAGFPLGWNEERDKWLYWSLPLMTTEYGFFTRIDEHNKFKNIEDLSGKEVGVFGPSNTSYSLQKLSDNLKLKGLEPLYINMLPDSNGQNLRKLAAKRIDAVFLNKDVGEYQLENLDIKGVVYSFGTKKLNYYIGFSKKNTDVDLVYRINKGLEKLQNSGELGDIVERYNLQKINENLEVR